MENTNISNTRAITEHIGILSANSERFGLLPFDQMDWSSGALRALPTPALVRYYRRFIEEMHHDNYDFGYGFNPCDPSHSFELGIRHTLMNRKIEATKNIEGVILERIPLEQTDILIFETEVNHQVWLDNRYHSKLVRDLGFGGSYG